MTLDICTSLILDSSCSRSESRSSRSSFMFILFCSSLSVSFKASSRVIWFPIFSSASFSPWSNRLKVSSNWFRLTLLSSSILSALTSISLETLVLSALFWSSRSTWPNSSSIVFSRLLYSFTSSDVVEMTFSCLACSSNTMLCTWWTALKPSASYVNN